MGSIPDTHGAHNVRAVANPGAGNIWTLTPITATRMRIIGLRFKFTTSVFVGNRSVKIQLLDATRVCSECPVGIAQTASLIWYYNLWPGYTGAPREVGGEVLLPWTPLFIMDQVFYLQGTSYIFDAGDAFTDIEYATEEWISEP